MRVALLLLVPFVLLTGCPRPLPPGPQGDAEARDLVFRAREAHGTDAYESAEMLRFDFRGVAFEASRHRSGHTHYRRTTLDDQGRTVIDELADGGVARTVAGEPAALSDDEAARIHTAVNSVVYFATLPAALTDAAVRARALGVDSVMGQPHRLLEVTFDQEGGGDDWEDRYLYWLHPEQGTIEYLAYSYRLAPGADGPTDTGHRFRRVIRVGDADGMRIQDYENLTADSLARLEDYPAAYEAGRTTAVSDVRTDNARLVR